MALKDWVLDPQCQLSRGSWFKMQFLGPREPGTRHRAQQSVFNKPLQVTWMHVQDGETLIQKACVSSRKGDDKILWNFSWSSRLAQQPDQHVGHRRAVLVQPDWHRKVLPCTETMRNPPHFAQSHLTGSLPHGPCPLSVSLLLCQTDLPALGL